MFFFAFCEMPNISTRPTGSLPVMPLVPASFAQTKKSAWSEFKKQ